MYVSKPGKGWEFLKPHMREWALRTSRDVEVCLMHAVTSRASFQWRDICTQCPAIGFTLRVNTEVGVSMT